MLRNVRVLQATKQLKRWMTVRNAGGILFKCLSQTRAGKPVSYLRVLPCRLA